MVGIEMDFFLLVLFALYKRLSGMKFNHAASKEPQRKGHFQFHLSFLLFTAILQCRTYFNSLFNVKL